MTEPRDSTVRPTLTCPSWGVPQPWPFWYHGAVKRTTHEQGAFQEGIKDTHLLRTVLALLAQFTVGLGRCLHETRLKQRLARLREDVLQG